jgi:uncharacterized protein
MPLRLVGRILEIWRYPVSSIGGERISKAVVRSDGIEGDRQFGLIDTTSGKPAVPEKEARWRKALHLKASFVGDAFPIVFFPDGRCFSLEDRTLNEALTDYFGFATSIGEYEHTLRRAGFPLTVFRHHHFPLHLLTTGSLERLAEICRTEAVDVRRFRPSILIQVEPDSGFAENDWTGERLRIGDLTLKAEEDTKRCGVTFISQPGLDEDPEILRNILRNNKRNLGIYCSTDISGTIEIGDAVSIDH